MLVIAASKTAPGVGVLRHVLPEVDPVHVAEGGPPVATLWRRCCHDPPHRGVAGEDRQPVHRAGVVGAQELAQVR